MAYQLKQHPEILADAAARRDLAAGFQAAVVDSLTSRAWLALEQEGCSRLVVCGGVAANGRLRQVLQEHARGAGLELFLPPPALCTDNAAMVAALGYRLLMAGRAPGPDRRRLFPGVTDPSGRRRRPSSPGAVAPLRLPLLPEKNNQNV